LIDIEKAIGFAGKYGKNPSSRQITCVIDALIILIVTAPVVQEKETALPFFY